MSDCEKGDFDPSFQLLTQSFLGLFCCGPELCHGFWTLKELLFGFLKLFLFQKMFDDALIDVVASQTRAPGVWPELEDAIDHLQDGDVKSASSQVIHGNSGAFRGGADRRPGPPRLAHE